MKPVPGVGPKRPKFIIIGELPGEEEEAQGIPFVGIDGKILDGMLASAMIKREECYITNVGKVRAPQSKAKNLWQLGFSIEDFYPSLYDELRGIDCQYAILLGDIALNALVHRDGIMKHRGSVYQCDVEGLTHLTCICTFNPGFVRELWSSRMVVVSDLKKAVRVSQGGYHPMTFNTTTFPSIEVCESYIDSLRRQCRAVSLDIEVVGRPAQIACVGIGGVFPEGRSSLCIPFKHGFTNYWSREQEMFVWNLIQQLLRDPNILKIGQYVLYDFTMLRPFIGEPAPPWFDTNVAHHLLDPELPHTLAFMTSTYVDVNYYKDDPKEDGESWKYISSSEQLWVYNGKDVEIPLVLEQLMTKELAAAGLLDFFRGYQMPLLRSVWRMGQRGMSVDEVRRQELLVDRIAKATTMQGELEAKVGHPLNVQSPKQMHKFVYEELMIPKQYHRKTHKVTLDEETINKLAARYPNPAFQLSLDLRGLYKEIGTYLLALPSEDGKMHGKWNPTGTETGRTSCTQTIFDREVEDAKGKVKVKKEGIDFQNVPEDLRGMYCAPPGKVFLMYDLWQAEFYATAVFAQCQAFLERLRKGQKTYKLVGSWLFHKSESEVDDINKPGGEYYRSKRTSHAANYGLAALKLSMILKCTKAEAQGYLDTFHAYAPEIRGIFQAGVQEMLTKTRKIVTPFGRQRIFRARLGEDMFREGYAGLPQSTIGDYLHQAFVKLDFILMRFRGAGLVHEGYDSLIIECYREDAPVIKELSAVAFHKVLWWKETEFSIPFEVKEGERWK